MVVYKTEGMYDQWDSDELILISITNNDFKNDRIYINTDGSDQTQRLEDNIPREP